MSNTTNRIETSCTLSWRTSLHHLPADLIDEYGGEGTDEVDENGENVFVSETRMFAPRAEGGAPTYAREEMQAHPHDEAAASQSIQS